LIRRAGLCFALGLALLASVGCQSQGKHPEARTKPAEQQEAASAESEYVSSVEKDSGEVCAVLDEAERLVGELDQTSRSNTSRQRPTDPATLEAFFERAKDLEGRLGPVHARLAIGNRSGDFLRPLLPEVESARRNSYAKAHVALLRLCTDLRQALRSVCTFAHVDASSVHAVRAVKAYYAQAAAEDPRLSPEEAREAISAIFDESAGEKQARQRHLGQARERLAAVREGIEPWSDLWREALGQP
jgi:hypothetical protein